MKPFIIMLCVGLAACGPRMGDVAPPSPGLLDTGLTKRCPPKPKLPASAKKDGMSEHAVIRFAGSLSVVYDDCARRFAKAMDIIEKRDAAK